MVDISVSAETPRRSRALIEDLKSHVQRNFSREGTTGTLEVKRTSVESQDLGTTLTIVLAAPAVVVLANAVRDWIQLNSGVSLQINGVSLDNLNSEDVASVINAINQTSSSKELDD